MAHNWTGNVRELKNLIERGVLTGKGPKLTLQDIGLEEESENEMCKRPNHETRLPPIPPTGIDLTTAQRSFEKFYIEESLKMAAGNESKAAKLLNINHHTFRYRRKKLQI